MKKRIVCILALTLMLALTCLAACKGDTPGGAPPPETAGQPGKEQPPDPGAVPAKEQYLNHFLGEEVSTVDACLTDNNVDEAVIMNIMEPLTRLIPTLDGGYEFMPAGAKSWSSNEDGTVWTFVLNDNFWEDGQAVTAQDYEYAIKRFVNPETASELGWQLDCLLNYYAITDDGMDLDELGVKATDDKTLVITLGESVPYFMELTAIQVMTPQRKDIVERYGEKYGSGAEFVLSCGPFKIESWMLGGTIVLVKNEKYWDVANVALDRINLALIQDSSTQMAAFENGEIDQVRAISAEWRDSFMAMPGVEYHPVPAQTILYYFFNTNDAIFQNVNIRRAFVMALDREQLCAMVYTGLREPCYGWVVPSISVGEHNFRKAAGDVVKAMAADYGDPRALLIEGMKELGLGEDPATLEITFKLAGTDQMFHTIGEYLQQNYKTKLGVNLEIDFSEWADFSGAINRHEYQIAQMSWGAYYNEPYDVLSLFISDWDSINTGWANDEYDALIRRASHELDDAKRLQLYIQAERILIYDYAVACPVAVANYQHFCRDYVQGARWASFGDVSYKLYDTSARP